MLICKYVFDSNIYNDYLPVFNDGFTYTKTDIVEDNLVTRTITSDTLPTLMRFGKMWSSQNPNSSNRELCLLTIDEMNTSELTTGHSMFRMCKNLRSINCNWNTSNVTITYSMFDTCNSLTSLDLSKWNTSKVTNMYQMFINCSNLTSLNLSNFNTSKVTDMNNMFQHCKSLTSLDLSNWDTSKVTNMGCMFQYCTSLTSLDLSNWDTSKVTNMPSMFNNCTSLTSLDLSNWDTSKVTNMGNMFINCTSLTSLDLSNWNIDLSILTNYQNLLSANALEVINLSFANQDTISVIYNSVPSKAITVKTTPENMAYATDTAPSNVTVIDVIATININTTKQQLIYNILYGIQNANIIPQTKEELILYGIMMGQAVNILPSSIKQELLLHISKGTKNANIVPQDKEELILYGIMMGTDIDVKLNTIVEVLYYNLLKKGM